MRIVFDSFDSFCEEISERAGEFVKKTVRAITLRQPEQDEGVSFQVGFMATAVVGDGDGRELLELAVQCGQDVNARTRKGEIIVEAIVTGSDGAAKLWAKLKTICEASGLRLRPGKIELY